MTTGRIDEQLHGHPKAEDAGLEAMGLWVLCLSYCCAYLTDGFVTTARVQRIAGAQGASLAKKLVTAGLWEVVEGGWQFHDWGHFQVSRVEALLERQRRVEAGRKGGKSKAAALARARADDRALDIASDTADALAEAESEATAFADELQGGLPADAALARARAGALPLSPLGQDLSQTDPDPIADSHPARAKVAQRKAALPDGWAPTDQDRAFAGDRGWDAARVAREAEGFAAHHTAKRTLSASWEASWRTWVLRGKAFEKQDARGARPGPTRAVQPPAPSLFTPAKEYR